MRNKLSELGMYPIVAEGRSLPVREHVRREDDHDNVSGPRTTLWHVPCQVLCGSCRIVLTTAALGSAAAQDLYPLDLHE